MVSGGASRKGVPPDDGWSGRDRSGPSSRSVSLCIRPRLNPTMYSDIPYDVFAEVDVALTDPIDGKLVMMDSVDVIH